MKAVIQRPSAAAIVGSLRSIGYSFNTAIADIIDNSISAGASSVFIRLETVSGQTVISIRDDGHGMQKEDLIEAMRHGGGGISRERTSNDLGRYGLGLKTASLSQCRRLTIASIATEGALSVARWDLDEVERRNEWVLLLPTKTDVGNFSSVRDLLKHGRGTVVVWQDFDLALAGATDTRSALEGLLDDARAHLALIFQRFLKGGDSEQQVEILINGQQTIGIDPFLSSNRKTQQLPSEDVKVGASRARITAFILPQLKNMTALELESLGGSAGIRQGQGFYVYRNKRLIVAATWFKMLRFDELTKLARVRIDIPNTMDDLWNLDVKKSTANPPEPIRRVLKRIVERIASRSFDVFRDPKSRGKATTITPVWLRTIYGSSVTYSLNRNHPIVAEIFEDGSRSRSRAGERILRLIEISVPYAMIFSDMNGQSVIEPSKANVEITLRELLKEWIARCGTDVDLKKTVIKALPSLEPFSRYPELTRALVEATTSGV